jgi:hydroxyquinol 1,2-dioxygenase
MRNLTESNLTDAVLSKLAGPQDVRFKQIMTSLIHHLHAFVREVEVTEEEWLEGIRFLTRTGHFCDDQRQEFILLSDTLGVSMLVDAINHRRPSAATENTVFGPFHVIGAPEFGNGDDITAGVPGEPTYVRGHVRSIDGRPIADAIIEVWQVRPDRLYDVQDPEAPGMQLRGKLKTDGEGRYAFWTIKPVSYSIPDDGPVGDMLKASGRHPWRPAHIHFMISAPGYETVVTHLFVEGDPYLNSDAVFGVKDSLVVDFQAHESGRAPDGKSVDKPFYTVHYDFRLTRA